MNGTIPLPGDALVRQPEHFAGSFVGGENRFAFSDLAELTIEVFYNRQRLHLSLSYRSLLAYQADYLS